MASSSSSSSSSSLILLSSPPQEVPSLNNHEHDSSATTATASSRTSPAGNHHHHHRDVAATAAAGIIMDHAAEASSNCTSNEVEEQHRDDHYHSNYGRKSPTNDLDADIIYHDNYNCTNNDAGGNQHQHQQQPSSSSFVVEKKKQAQVATNNQEDFLELASWSNSDDDDDDDDDHDQNNDDDMSFKNNENGNKNNFDMSAKDDDDEVAEAIAEAKDDDDDDDDSDIVEIVIVENQRKDQHQIQIQQPQHHYQQHLPPQPTNNYVDSTTTAPGMTPSTTSTNNYTNNTAAAMASYHARNQHMPQWMRMMPHGTSATRSNTMHMHAVNNNPPNSHHHHHQGGGSGSSRAMDEAAVGATASSSAHNHTSSSSSFHNHHHLLNNHLSDHQIEAASIPHHHQQQQQQHHPPQQQLQQHQYRHQEYYHEEKIAIPKSHTPTWSDILPKSCCIYYQRQQRQQQQQQQQQQYLQQRQQPRKKLTLSLINMWEFTITIESLTMFSSSYYYHHGSSNTTNTTTTTDSTNGLRAQIKRIAREHIGRDGRRGAIYERSGNIGEEDPLMLKESMVSSSSSSSATSSSGLQPQQPYLGDGSAQGKWRIPLGAYHSLMSYLTNCSQNYVVEGIPSDQLRVATLGRERMDKKSYPTASELISRNVSPRVCAALAPYQRGGVDFILDREGCALLADEMGLGKTLMAIGAMSAYRDRDWPLLVLCPSSARYHWEMEFRHWMGVESRTMMGGGGVMGDSRPSDDDVPNGNFSSLSTASAAAAAATLAMKQAPMDDDDSILMNEQINVLTSGKDVILKRNGSTRVVICSIGLIVNLANSNQIYPGMFQAIVVDESHVLKSQTSKRTMAVLPLLKAARRCLLLSGTPAFARPAELWPQLSVLRSRGNRSNIYGESVGNIDQSSSLGIWCNEEEFMYKYVKGKGEEGKMTRLAELHTLLSSTVMIRRMKADILKNMPPKLREKAYINIEDETLRNDFRIHMQLLRQGRGVLGKLARKHRGEVGVSEPKQSHVRAGENGALHHKEVLHHLYKISGQAKVPRIAKTLKRFLSDPANGKVCIFAHHLDVLDSIGIDAGLSNSLGSTTRYIRIDGSTSPKARQEQILEFQTDPAIRVALLGITAAGVAVTLTASSTVWFAELFWTPAIMIQAEDRCHRIGQQARVRCLYFIAKETLDEILWKLIDQKFREIGEFVDGKENMGIALERELEDGEDEAILRLDDNDEITKKRKSQDICSEELLDPGDLELKKEIEELCHEEEDMFNLNNADDDDELDVDEKTTQDSSESITTSGGTTAPTKTTPSKEVIDISDEDEDEDEGLTISQIRKLRLESGAMGSPSIGPQVQFKNLRLYSVNYPGPSYGLNMVQCHGRVIIKSHNPSNNLNLPRIGAILVGVNGVLLPHRALFGKVLLLMKRMIKSPPVSIMYAEDDEFTSFFNEVFVPNLPPQPSATAPLPAGSGQNSEFVDLTTDK